MSFMKNSTLKLIFIMFIILTLTIMPFAVKAADSAEAIILVKSGTEKIVYVKGMEEKEFKYAFSNNEDSASAMYVTATKDSNGKYAAILDDGNTYKNMFVMEGNDTSKASTIKLENAKSITSEEVEKIEKLTKIIGVKTDEKETNIKKDDGTIITTTKGKIVVTDEGKYQYQLIEVVDKNNSTAKLNDTAVELYNQLDALNNADTMFDKLSAEITIRDNYKKLLEDAKWEDAVNGKEILEPENSVKGEKYVVLIQEIDKDGKTIRTDVQFMTCDRADDAGEAVTETRDKKVEKKINLPVTGENLALYITFGVIILAIIILAVKMKKEKAKDNEEK